MQHKISLEAIQLTKISLTSDHQFFSPALPLRFILLCLFSLSSKGLSFKYY